MTPARRRRCRAIARGLGWITRLGAWLALALWGVGAIASDRWAWSQPLSWIPTPVALALSALLLGIGWGLARLGRGARRPSRVVGLIGLVAWLACAASLAHECRVTRYAFAPKAPAPDLRVLFWNSASASLEYPPDTITSHAPDLAIFVDLRWGMGREMLARCAGQDATSLWIGGFCLASRYPVLRWGHTLLGFRGVRAGMDPDVDGAAAYDSGEAMFLEIETTESLGRPTIVWVLDIPSDPRLRRTDMFRQVLDRTRAWTRGVNTAGFPAPDVIIGDLNTPRGAASLRLLAPNATSAYAQAGRGWVASWPRRWPLWHIDHVLVGQSLRATSYRIVDPGRGTHRMQIVDLTARRR